MMKDILKTKAYPFGMFELSNLKCALIWSDSSTTATNAQSSGCGKRGELLLSVCDGGDGPEMRYFAFPSNVVKETMRYAAITLELPQAQAGMNAEASIDISCEPCLLSKTLAEDGSYFRWVPNTNVVAVTIVKGVLASSFVCVSNDLCCAVRSRSPYRSQTAEQHLACARNESYVIRQGLPAAPGQPLGILGQVLLVGQMGVGTRTSGVGE